MNFLYFDFKKRGNTVLKHDPASLCESGFFIQCRFVKIVIGTIWSSTLSTKTSKASPE